MLDKTLGYILCCQSRRCFWPRWRCWWRIWPGASTRSGLLPPAAVHFVSLRRGAVFPGNLQEYFTIRDFFLIRTAGWIGLAIAAFFVLLALVRAFFAAADARREQKRRHPRGKRAPGP